MWFTSRPFQQLNSLVELGMEERPISLQEENRQMCIEFKARIHGFSQRTHFYISHLIRAGHEENAKARVLLNMKDGVEGLAVGDFKMKVLPTKHREAQVDFFGKAAQDDLVWNYVRNQKR